MKQFKRLEDFCNLEGIKYDSECAEKFSAFCDLLVESNKSMNLTAITDEQQIEIKHFIDSLESASLIAEESKKHFCNCAGASAGDKMKVIDIGTGAGFPGVPLAIVFPDVDFVLNDALNKRIVFLENAVRQIGLLNVKTIHSRAEDLGTGTQREYFDICVSRAVADMSVLAEYCIPMVKTGGIAIFYKSGEYETELSSAEAAINTLGGSVESVKCFELAGTDQKRSLIIIRKLSPTPSKYPRKAGKPSKSPIS